MYRSRHESSVVVTSGSLADPRRSRLRGLTLVELMMAMTVTAILSVVLGGLVLAVQYGEVALFIGNALRGTDDTAGAAVDAELGIDDVDGVTGA